VNVVGWHGLHGTGDCCDSQPASACNCMQVFLERKILGLVSGPETEQFHAWQGYLALENTVKELGADHPYTALVPNLENGADPDDAFSRIPYEKGFYFLYYLQRLCGGPAAFEPFIKAYLEHFALTTVTTEEFREFLLSYFQRNQDLQDLDWEMWLHKPGASWRTPEALHQGFGNASPWRGRQRSSAHRSAVNT
jgi:aminopeptidase N